MDVCENSFNMDKVQHTKYEFGVYPPKVILVKYQCSYLWALGTNINDDFLILSVNNELVIEISDKLRLIVTY